jgi:hypothetical protein
MCEFRAGKMSLEGTRVVPDTRKGLVRVGRVWILKIYTKLITNKTCKLVTSLFHGISSWLFVKPLFRVKKA